MAKTVDREASDGQRSPKDVGRQLRQVRRKQGLSRGEVARSAGLTRRELAAYERGRTEVPESDLWCLAGSCGVDVGELLPKRAPVKVSSDLSLLAVGDSIRYLRSPVDNDELLREYMSMIYELRNVAPGSRVPLRERDLMALADALGGSPETIESRLIELIGVSRFEATRLREMILPTPPALPEAPPMPAPRADVYGALGEPTDVESDAQIVDFFSAPRASDPFEPPPPPPPRPAAPAPAPAPAWDIVGVPPDVGHLPADPFSAMPDTSAIASASFEAHELSPVRPLDEFASSFGSSVEPTFDPNLDSPFAPPGGAPGSEAWTPAPTEAAAPLAWSSEPVDASFGPTFSSPTFANPTFANPTFTDASFAAPMFTDPTFTDATMTNATFTDATGTDAPAMGDQGTTAPLDLVPIPPVTPIPPAAPRLATSPLAPPDLAPPDLAPPDFAPPDLAPPDFAPPDLAPPNFAPMEPIAPITSAAPVAPLAPLAPLAPADQMDPIAPIVWVARADLDEPLPTPTTGNGSGIGPSNGFVRAGSNWRIGGIFPATAAADDGTLALRRADARWALADVQAPGDFTIEAVVDFAAGVGFGVLFRATVDDSDRISGYSFDIDPIAGGGGYLLRQWEDNKQHWRPMAQASVTDPSRLFGRHLVAVTLRADQLTVTVDGDASLSLPSLTRSSIELGQAPCRGSGVGVQAWATTEVTVESFRVARS